MSEPSFFGIRVHVEPMRLRYTLPIDMIDTGPTWGDVIKSIAQLVLIGLLGIGLVTGGSIVIGMILAADWIGG